jgi:hypothetical protein
MTCHSLNTAVDLGMNCNGPDSRAAGASGAPPTFVYCQEQIEGYHSIPPEPSVAPIPNRHQHYRNLS